MTIGLTIPGCRGRQKRLRDVLVRGGFEAAILTNPRYVHYFTGYWGRDVYASAVVILANGPTILASPQESAADIAADVQVTYEAARTATLLDDQPGEALRSLAPHLAGIVTVGADAAIWPHLLPGATIHDLSVELLALRRTKDADEVALLRHAIDGCEAAYAAARSAVRAGLSEIELFALVQAAAVEQLGESIGELGNDFRAGSSGGEPRRRAMQAGELLPLDLGVVVRGYCSDLCRTLCVGGAPTAAQQEAHRLVVEALEFVEGSVKPGVSCRAIYQDVFAMLDGRNGWRFPHHLGHGVGLAPHEAPRLNPHWDDTFMVGDVFTVEPGLYGDDLRGGVRLEQEYLVTESGLERLSHAGLQL